MIQIFKLINGETVVADAIKTKTGYKFRKPMVMVSTVDPELGVAGLALYKWIPFSEEDISVMRTSIVALTPASQKLKQFYNTTWDRISKSHMNDEESDLYDSKEEADQMARALKDFKSTIQ
jgi:hypothetical protein